MYIIDTDYYYYYYYYHYHYEQHSMLYAESRIALCVQVCNSVAMATGLAVAGQGRARALQKAESGLPQLPRHGVGRHGGRARDIPEVRALRRVSSSEQ
jgi:hypothetical protein